MSDYQTITITFQTIAGGKATKVLCNGVQIASEWGGAHVVDVKTLATAQNLTTISEIKLFVSDAVESCNIYIASIELVLAD